MNYYVQWHTPGLIRRRVELNAEIRQATIARNAVPILGDTANARRWRIRHQRQFTSAVSRCRRELKQIAAKIGPPPALWKPRKLPGLVRMARQYDGSATMLLCYPSRKALRRFIERRAAA